MNYPAIGDDFDRFLGEVRKIKPLSREHEYDLAVSYYETGDPEAAQELVIGHLPFVVRVALLYRHYHLPMLDLVQEGMIGLMRALKRFDPYKGYRLATFAVWWIKAYIQNFIIKHWSLIKLGTTQAQRRLFYHLGRVNAQSEETPKEVRLRELAEELGIREEDVIEMDARLRCKELSLDEPIDTCSDLKMIDRVQDPSPNQEELMVMKDLGIVFAKRISDAMRTLDAREQFLTSKRYLEDPPWTLNSIGKHFGITRERARQLERRALKKLKRELQLLKDQGLLNWRENCLDFVDTQLSGADKSEKNTTASAPGLIENLRSTA